MKRDDLHRPYGLWMDKYLASHFKRVNGMGKIVVETNAKVIRHAIKFNYKELSQRSTLVLNVRF